MSQLGMSFIQMFFLKCRLWIQDSSHSFAWWVP